MSFYSKTMAQLGEVHPVLPPPIPSINLADDTIITYDRDGNVLSRFADTEWDFSAISFCRDKFKFDTNRHSASIIRELKTLLYARLYWSPTVRSLSSLRLTPLAAIGDWASANKISVSKVLNDKRLFPWLASSLSSLGKREAEAIATVVSELAKIRVAHSSLTIAPGDFELAELLQSVAASIPGEQTRQTAVIPSRLYASIIVAFEAYLREFNANAEGVKNFYRMTVEGLSTGGAQHETPLAFKLWYKKQHNYSKIIASYGLSDLVEKYSLRDKKRWNTYIRNVQQTAKCWIHLFTGMRDQEVNTLARDCLNSLNIKGIKAKIVQGYTTKTIGSGASNTYWITGDIIDIGVDAAKALGELAAIQNKWDINTADFPLFPIIFTMGNTTKLTTHGGIPYSGGLSGYRINDWLSVFPSLVVTESDMAELYAFDGFRSWDKEIKVGETWPLATHQCRRSLAVYLARSGLVSVGSLQLQFKHLLSAMTSYYRRNSIFAKNFILNDLEDDYHQAQLQMMDSIETERRVAQFLSFEEMVVGNQTELWGGEGARIRRAHESGRPIVILTDRQRLKKSFVDGEIHFREGPMGGCVNVGTCDKLSVTKIGAPCLSCANFIGNDESITSAQKALATLYKTRDRYPKTSLHYRQVQSDINDFEAKLDKAIGGRHVD